MPVDRWIDRPRESSNCIVYYCLMADGRAQQEGTEADLPAIGNKLIVNVHSDRIDLLIIFNEAIVPPTIYSLSVLLLHLSSITIYLSDVVSSSSSSPLISIVIEMGLQTHGYKIKCGN